jgi:RNA polymerase sigma factor (sigma-70 family)
LKILELLAAKHDTWVEITMTFGLDKMTAEDIVQNMYIKIHAWSEKNEDKTRLMYNKDEVNYYFVFKTLRTLFYDYNRKANRNVKYGEKAPEALSEDYIYDLIDVKVKEQHIKLILEQLHWYDKKVFNLVYKENISMLQLSEMTGISYYSIYRTIQKVKRTIKKNICD